MNFLCGSTDQELRSTPGMTRDVDVFVPGVCVSFQH